MNLNTFFSLTFIVADSKDDQREERGQHSENDHCPRTIPASHHFAG